MSKKEDAAKIAMGNAIDLFTDKVTECTGKEISEKEGFLVCKFTFSRKEVEFADDDVEIFEQLLINLGGFDGIETMFNIPRKQMFVTAYYGGKPVKTRRAKAAKNTRKDTKEIIENSLWAMKEMYDCLCGMYSEQGDGFASTFVKDEAKMMDTAEKYIPYMEALLSAVKNKRGE